mmetsp:Transcript_3573/g.14427  ORF Transcript_3573/g.14427 Transcript_3573/m.14427 type:complete len:218 (-) Transcript_3573:321-974(-)
MATSRSHQPRSVRVNWCTGMASKNSCATRMVGPFGTPSRVSCHATGTPPNSLTPSSTGSRPSSSGVLPCAPEDGASISSIAPRTPSDSTTFSGFFGTRRDANRFRSASASRASPLARRLNVSPHRRLFLCISRSAGLTSTMCTETLCVNSLNTEVARSRSAMSVPLPGPSSMSLTFLGFPSCVHCHTAHAPMSSPNTWLTSGLVMKSPLWPKTSRCM